MRAPSFGRGALGEWLEGIAISSVIVLVIVTGVSLFHAVAGCAAQAKVVGVDISPDLKLDIAPEIKPQATPTVIAATGDGGTVNQYTLTVASAGWGGLATVLALLAGWRGHHWKRAAYRCVGGIEIGTHVIGIKEHISRSGVRGFRNLAGDRWKAWDRTEHYIRHAIKQTKNATKA